MFAARISMRPWNRRRLCTVTTAFSQCLLKFQAHVARNHQTRAMTLIPIINPFLLLLLFQCLKLQYIHSRTGSLVVIHAHANEATIHEHLKISLLLLIA
jgi:hypothetical protein